MLALWLPVTNHCRLESVPGLEFLRCATAVPTGSDCDGDGCDVVEDGFYKVEEANVVAVQPLCVPVFHLAPLIDHSPPEISNYLLSAATPPELGNTWQFSCRAAAPPRAPSLAS